MADKPDHVQIALQEIARLVAEAERSGVELDDWVQALASELGAQPQDTPADASALAMRIRSDPDESLRAQGHPEAQNLRSLSE